jgi:hypothetical protein
MRLQNRVIRRSATRGGYGEIAVGEAVAEAAAAADVTRPPSSSSSSTLLYDHNKNSITMEKAGAY